MTQPQQPNSDQDDTSLAPIPSDGTSAPSDSERIFGKSTGNDSSPDGQRSGGPGRSRQPLDEEQQRALRIRGRLAIILGFGGLFIGVLFLPSGPLIGLPLGLAGGALGLGALVRGRKAGVSVPGAAPAIVIGAVSLLFTISLAVLAVMFSTEAQRLGECMQGANTRIAQETCVEQLEQDMKERGYDLNLTEVPGSSGATGFLDTSPDWLPGD